MTICGLARKFPARHSNMETISKKSACRPKLSRNTVKRMRPTSDSGRSGFNERHAHHVFGRVRRVAAWCDGRRRRAVSTGWHPEVESKPWAAAPAREFWLTDLPAPSVGWGPESALRQAKCPDSTSFGVFCCNFAQKSVTNSVVFGVSGQRT